MYIATTYSWVRWHSCSIHRHQGIKENCTSLERVDLENKLLCGTLYIEVLHIISETKLFIFNNNGY